MSARSAAGLFGLRPALRAESRPSGLIPHAPSRLWRCALRFPPGESPAAIPAAQAWRPSIPPNRQRRIGRASAAPQWAGRQMRRGLLRQVVRMRAVHDAGARCLGVTKDGSRRCHPALLGGSTPRCEHGRLHGTGRVSAGRWGVARHGSGGMLLKPSCGDAEVAMPPFGLGWFGPRRPCVVVNPGGGAAAPRASWLQPSGENNFPAAVRLLAGQIVFSSRCSTVLRPQAVQPARPPPAGSQQGRDGREPCTIEWRLH